MGQVLRRYLTECIHWNLIAKYGKEDDLLANVGEMTFQDYVEVIRLSSSTSFHTQRNMAKKM